MFIGGHDGVINITSKKNKGSVFDIYFPQAEEKPLETRARIQPSA